MITNKLNQRYPGLRSARGYLLRMISAWLVFLSVILAAACSSAPSSPTPFLEFPEIETAEDLQQMLRSGGFDVQAGDSIDHPELLGQGSMLMVDGSELQIFEYTDSDSRAQVSSRISADGLFLDETPLVWPDRPNIWATGRIIVIYAGSEGGTILILSALMDDPITFEAPIVDEPFPPAVSAAIEFLASSLGINPSEIKVVSFAPVDWPDGCLGLAGPDEACISVITPGWEIVLEADGSTYALRADILGEQLRPESGSQS